MLPLELWMQISFLACDDDGSTGRSLSLVSHTLHDASKPHKFRSVAVRGDLQIVRFVRYLESLPLEQRNVENLYITTWTDDAELLTSTEPEHHLLPSLRDLYKPGICDRTPGPEPHEIRGDGEELLVHAISRILTCVSTTVRVAHILLNCYRDFIFFPVKFHKLEELGLQGPFECSYRGYIPHLPQIPTLRRLKITHATLYDNTTLLDSIAAYAPNLTHLYCQISNPYHSQTVAQLEKIFHPPSGNSDIPNCFPQTLQKMYLHPGQKDPPGMCGTGYALLFAAKRLLHAYCTSEPRMVLLKESSYKYELRAGWDQIGGEEEWLDRIRGGAGCWDASNEMTTLY